MSRHASCAASTSGTSPSFSCSRGEAPDEAARHAATVLRFETELAKSSRNPLELRDPEGNYHKLTLAELSAQAPGLDWAAYFKALGLPDPGPIDVGQPEFFKRAAALAASGSLDDWKTYLTWTVLDDSAAYLSSDFENESFRFNSTILRGVQEQPPRWKRVLRVTDEGIGQELGKLYVADHFPPEAKARALAMVNDLKDALRERINAVDWMGPQTKAAAVKKLGSPRREDRLPGQVAGLFRAGNQGPALRAQRRGVPRVRVQTRTHAHRANPSIPTNGT